MTKILLFTIRKGGVGKTTIATNQAVLFAEKSKTLLIDLDPQGNVINQFGYDPYKIKANTVIEVAEGKTNIESATIKENNHGVKNLEILPANFKLDDYYANNNKAHFGLIIKLIDRIAKSNKYDYIIIDTNPAWNDLIAGLIQLANAICIPFIPEPNSQLATVDFINEILPSARNFSAKGKLLIIPNRFAIKKRQGKIIEDINYQIVKELEDLVKNNKDKNIFITPAIKNSMQYTNSIGFDKKPLTFVSGISAYRSPKKQQKVLNEFIISKI